MSQFNKKVLGAGAAVVALSAFVPNPFLIGEAMAQATATDTMNVTAKVVNPMDISQKVKLNFGQFAVGAAGSAKIGFAATGAISVSVGDAVLIGNEVLGKVLVNAPPGAPFDITVADLAATPIVLNHSGGGGAASKTFKLNKIFLLGSANLSLGGATNVSRSLVAGGNTNTSAVINGGGTSGTATIGGQLTAITNDQLPGTYTATYTMQVTL